MTFLINFCRSGNLSALLKDEKLPMFLLPYLKRLRTLYEPMVQRVKDLSNSRMMPLDKKTLKMLVGCLNTENSDGCIWIDPCKWAELKDEEAIAFSPVQAKAVAYKQVQHNDVSYSTFHTGQNNSFVLTKPDSEGICKFGRIISIFLH